MWESIKLVITAFAIIYGTAYGIGFTYALFKHRKEIADQCKPNDTVTMLIIAWAVAFILIKVG